MARRACPRGDGRIKPININRHIITLAFGDSIQHGFNPHFAELPYRHNITAERPSVVIAFFGGGRNIADTNLAEPFDVIFFRRPPHRVAMPRRHAVANINKIKMGIHLHQMKRLLVTKRVDARNIDRMITPQNNGNRARVQDSPHAFFNIGMALFGIGMDNISITNINNAALVFGQVSNVIFMVISPGMTE